MMVEDDEGGALYGEDEASSNGFGFGEGCTWSGVLEERERVEREAGHGEIRRFWV